MKYTNNTRVHNFIMSNNNEVLFMNKKNIKCTGCSREKLIKDVDI